MTTYRWFRNNHAEIEAVFANALSRIKVYANRQGSAGSCAVVEIGHLTDAIQSTTYLISAVPPEIRKVVADTLYRRITQMITQDIVATRGKYYDYAPNLMYVGYTRNISPLAGYLEGVGWRIVPTLCGPHTKMVKNNPHQLSICIWVTQKQAYLPLSKGRERFNECVHTLSS